MRLSLPNLEVRPWHRWLQHPVHARTERLTAEAADGVQLAIHRVRGEGPPVLLLHGLGGNRYTYLLEGRSLAGYLAEQGFDCYVAEVRGAGESGTRHWRYDLEDHLRWDLPVVLEHIRAVSGARVVHWVGHSLGGVMLMCHGIGREAHGLGRGVCIGSALSYRGSAFQPLLALKPALSRLTRLPFGTLTHLVAPLAGRVRNPFELFNFWAPNIEPALVRAMHANAFGPIPISLLLSLVGAVEPSGLCSRDGSVRYLDGASRCAGPVLLMAGSEDRQCPISLVEATAAAIGSRAQVERFGRAYGQAEEYGHLDLILGRRAPQEVWPRIEAWLKG